MGIELLVAVIAFASLGITWAFMPAASKSL